MKRILILLFSLAVVAVAALAIHKPLRFWTLAQMGKASGCIPSRAWAIPSDKVELTRVKDDILSHSRLIEKERNGLEHFGTPYGEFWTPANSQYVLPFNLAEEATHIYGTGERFVHHGDIVLDCGANVGTFARFALAAGAKQVIAIEPAPDNLECLRRNFASEIASGRLVIYPKGVWDKDDMLEMLIDPENEAADSFVIHRPGAKPSIKLPLTTIDKLVAELHLERVDFIKMDIEGAEVKALTGARETLARFHPRMSLCTYHRDQDPVEVPQAARAGWAGYRVECGPCNAEGNHVRPDVLYFY